MRRFKSLAFLGFMFVLAIIPMSALNGIAPQVGNTMEFGPSSGAPQSAPKDDHRVSSVPIDARLVVYCNAPAGPVAIWGTDPQSGGHGLVSFTMTEINDTSGQISRQALTGGGESLGTVVIVPHGNGSFSVTWSGGPWGANGAYPFALGNVSCE